MKPTKLYREAEQRINDTPELEPYRELLLTDWPEGDEHLEWVVSAPVEELLSWARATQTDNEIGVFDDCAVVLFDRRVGDEMHTVELIGGRMVAAFRWIPGGQFTRNSNVGLLNDYSMYSVDGGPRSIQALGFRRRADMDEHPGA